MASVSSTTGACWSQKESELEDHTGYSPYVSGPPSTVGLGCKHLQCSSKKKPPCTTPTGKEGLWGALLALPLPSPGRLVGKNLPEMVSSACASFLLHFPKTLAALLWAEQF